jgi:hypothetical protein
MNQLIKKNQDHARPGILMQAFEQAGSESGARAVLSWAVAVPDGVARLPTSHPNRDYAPRSRRRKEADSVNLKSQIWSFKCEAVRLVTPAATS